VLIATAALLVAATARLSRVVGSRT
jgi:hypothetical protein